ncbi:beta-glucanase (GH16 family) [Lewinella aquimaris]|uniref:Beta-glucanase (GH16 family) n=1 Tax=Neolewinella aquimaris TaxID=1835722 RepID=A0A840E625_9BACT|nr:glycoside hydrolase family 16 protein [Neolewinella aquimaris]MBB4080510.1 beta-glucanase (GH16 family) [Neolewinella aquimaris]
MYQIFPLTIVSALFFTGCSTTATPGQSVAEQNSQRQLLWSDEFNGNQLDTTNWNILLGDGCPNLCGWGNNERQIYTADNHRLEDGNLIITVRKEGDTYTSTRLSTKDKHAFKYGRIEARANLPVGEGLWPAFWMLGQNIDEVGWPLAGEIDILEYVGRAPGEIFTTLHTAANHGGNATTRTFPIPNIEEGYHVFAVEWTADWMTFHVDDQLVHTFDPAERTEEVWPFDQPFFILLNVAIGGNFGGPEVDDSVFPQEYLVDYVRVYAPE